MAPPTSLPQAPKGRTMMHERRQDVVPLWRLPPLEVEPVEKRDEHGVHVFLLVELVIIHFQIIQARWVAESSKIYVDFKPISINFQLFGEVLPKQLRLIFSTVMTE